MYMGIDLQAGVNGGEGGRGGGGRREGKRGDGVDLGLLMTG